MAVGVTSIGNGTFQNCIKLTEVIIPDSVTSIGNGTFQYCSSLTEIVIPESVKSIGDYAFSDCNSLRKIYFLGTTPPTANNSAFEYCPEDMIIYYPEGAEANWGTEWQGSHSGTAHSDLRNRLQES